MDIDNLTEFSLINKIKKWLNNSDLVVPIGDDAAAFKLDPQETTLFAADSLVEDVHFKLNKISPQDLGYKSLAVNISDIAAMGGNPLFATVCLGLPRTIDLDFIKNLYQGLMQAADQYGVKIVGGDISTSSQLFISISLIGQSINNKILTRSSANIGDLILVTGSLGASAAGLKSSQPPPRRGKLSAISGQLKTLDIETIDYSLSKHFRPVPRVKEAQMAAQMGIKTAIDISDGLANDCQRICESSKVGCRLWADKIPIDKKIIQTAPKLGLDPLQTALSGGEDYELVFAAPNDIAAKVFEVFKQNNWPLTQVGEIIAGNSLEVIDSMGNIIDWEKGYEHVI